MDIEKNYLTWGSIETLLTAICFQLEHQTWFPTIIVGITRGGLIPATMLSQRLNVPMTTIDVSFRDNCFFGPESSIVPELIDRHKILIMDDINDSGKTFDWIMKDWFVKTNKMGYSEDISKNYIKFGCLIHNIPSISYSDFYGEMINKDKDPNWISFPWEHWFEK